MMWIVQLALRRKYTFVVMSLFIAVLGVLTIFRTPTDILPNIDVPVVSVIWQFGGMLPKEMSGRIITVCERAMTTTVNDIEHIESQTYPGIGVIKVFFQPGANAQAGVAQVTAINQTLLRAFPPGTTPPLILQYNASSVPVVQLGISSKTLSVGQLFDLTTNFIRTQLATVQGASVPTPYGGSPRQIMVDLDMPALQARGMSPTDVINAISSQSIIAPSGTVKIGKIEYPVTSNIQPDSIPDYNKIPIKMVNGVMTKVGDVANAHDGNAVTSNMVNKDGRPGVLITILKSGNASTLDVVSRINNVLPKIRAGMPKELEIQPLFDQSIFVKASVLGVVREAVIAAILTATMILLFLGSWRSTLAVAISIPLSILFSIIVMGALGQTINIMTLGGLSLAVGILVDDATVEIENTNRNLAMGHKSLTRAILDGAAQIASPTFVATLSICIVFIPVVFLQGTAKSLFTPLAMAVVFAMLASYLLSRTLVPVMVQFLLKKDMARIIAEEHEEERRHISLGMKHPEGEDISAHDVDPDKGDIIWRVHHRFNEHFASFRDRYVSMLTWALDHRTPVFLVFLVFFGASFALTPLIGQDFFPNVDAGQIALHAQGPSGQRLEETGHFFHKVEGVIRDVIPPNQIDTILDNIGLPVSGINLAYSASPTIGELDGDILIALKPEHRPVEQTVDELRTRLIKEFPGATFFFTPADITTQILDFGLPAPIDIQVVGRDPMNYALAKQIARDIRGIPGAVDVHVHQVNDVPEMDIKIDRNMAQSVGLTERDVSGNVLASLVGTGQVTPSFYLDTKTGVSYLVAVQSPQREIDSIGAMQNIPILPSAGGNPAAGGMGSSQQLQLLSNLATIERTTSAQVVNHYNVQPIYDIYVANSGRDLGGVASDIEKVLGKYKPKLPRGTSIDVRGQVQSMRSSFTGLGAGLIFAVLLVYLLMVVNFQSWVDPLIIITALPGALSGILWMLFVTQTTFSVPSLMGAIMCIGVATSNSILLITFANDRRAEGDTAIQAAIAAGFTRLRPVLMTALALVLGMLPMALGMGEGGEQNAPLGRAVIGGASVATFSTLFFVPIIYSWLRRKQFVMTDDEIEIDRYVADEEDIKTQRMREAQRAGELTEAANQGAGA